MEIPTVHFASADWLNRSYFCSKFPLIGQSPYHERVALAAGVMCIIEGSNPKRYQGIKDYLVGVGTEMVGGALLQTFSPPEYFLIPTVYEVDLDGTDFVVAQGDTDIVCGVDIKSKRKPKRTSEDKLLNPRSGIATTTISTHSSECGVADFFTAINLAPDQVTPLNYVNQGLQFEGESPPFLLGAVLSLFFETTRRLEQLDNGVLQRANGQADSLQFMRDYLVKVSNNLGEFICGSYSSWKRSVRYFHRAHEASKIHLDRAA